MPHHPAPTAPPPHTPPAPPTLLQYLWASGQKILKNCGTSFSRTIRHFSPLVSLFTDCHRLRWDGSGAIFCKLKFISKPCLLLDAWHFLLFSAQTKRFPRFQKLAQSLHWSQRDDSCLWQPYVNWWWESVKKHIKLLCNVSSTPSKLSFTYCKAHFCKTFHLTSNGSSQRQCSADLSEAPQKYIQSIYL